MEEKLCVKWSDFHENINSSFASIRKDFEFTDVTLACEDGQQLESQLVTIGHLIGIHPPRGLVPGGVLAPAAGDLGRRGGRLQRPSGFFGSFCFLYILY